jgi:hypothetical protein
VQRGAPTGEISTMLIPLLASLLLGAAPAAADSLPGTSVTLLLGRACGPVDTVTAESFVLESDETPRGGRLHLVRIPDERTDQLQRRDGRGLPARLVVDSAGVRLLEVWLQDVTTRAYRLTSSVPDASLETQRLSLEETLAQLRAEHAEAARALAMIEALDKQRVTARLELPRARERVATLAFRVGAQEERLQALVRLASRRRVLEERVTLGFSALAMQPPPDPDCASAARARPAGLPGRR